MEQSDRDTIQRNIKGLSEMVNLETLHRELIARGVIDQVFIERIKAKYTVPQEQAQEFFLSYTKRGPQAFQILVDALHSSGHISEGNALNPTSAAGSPSHVSSTTEENCVTSSQNESSTLGQNPFGLNSSSSNSPTSSASVPSSPHMRHNLHNSRVEPLSGSSSPVSSSSSSIPTLNQLHHGVSRCSMDDEQELEIVVKEAQLYNMGEYEAYPMLSRPRGFALIINNIEFLGDVSAKREGAEKDTTQLSELLTRLGFKVTIRHNVKKMDLIDRETGIIKRFIDQFKTKTVSACVVAIMSHGKEGHIRSHDAENGRNPSANYWHFYSEILNQFNNRHCPILKGKPKIFIVQACQGENRDRGVRRTQTDGRDLTTAEHQISSSVCESSVSCPPDNIPETEDIVVCYSTVPGFVSNRDRELGTWYIRCLCKVFMESAWNTELIMLLRKVGVEMRGLTSEYGTKQMSSFHVMGLHYPLYFNPGLFPNNINRQPFTQ